MQFLVLLLSLAAAQANYADPNSVAVTKDYPATFRGCYDGDTCTFDLVLNEQELALGFGLVQRQSIVKYGQKMRLCNIDAPEIKPGPNPAAIKARDDMTKWIYNAKDLRVRVPQRKVCDVVDLCDEHEKYGRLLGFVMADGVNLNQKMLDAGNAKPYITCK